MAEEVLEKIENRAAGLRTWLSESAPYISADQKHLDANTPERAYWHHGYLMALQDVAKMMRLQDG